MAHVVTAPCDDCRYTDCCVVCPVEAFYQDDRMLYIHPSYCDDCEACVPECPVEAIYAEHDVPVRWQGYIQLNADRCKVLEDKGQITIKQEPMNGPNCEEN